MIETHGAFKHDGNPVFFSENFGGAAAPAVARVSQRSFSDTPIVLIVDTRVPGVNSHWNEHGAGAYFVSDQVPVEAIIAAVKVNPANLEIQERVNLV